MSRAQGHAKHARVCKCGRTIRGNAYTQHVRACAAFIAFYRDYAPDVLRKYGVDVEPEASAK